MNIKNITTITLAIFTYWLLFGGGELNSPSWGIQFLLWISHV